MPVSFLLAPAPSHSDANSTTSSWSLVVAGSPYSAPANSTDTMLPVQQDPLSAAASPARQHAHVNHDPITDPVLTLGISLPVPTMGNKPNIATHPGGTHPGGTSNINHPYKASVALVPNYNNLLVLPLTTHNGLQYCSTMLNPPAMISVMKSTLAYHPMANKTAQPPSPKP